MAARDRYGGSYGSVYGMGGRAPFGNMGFGGGYRDDRRPEPYRGPPPKSAGGASRKRSRSPGSRRGESNRRTHEQRSQGNTFHSRYEVHVPSYDLKSKELAVTDIKKRFPKMYVPSDFFNCDLRWSHCFPAYKPFSFGSACNFHVFHKEVEYPEELAGFDDASVLDPPDVDYAFSAKVMLLASSDLTSLYQHTIRAADEELAATAEKLNWMRQFHFLVGTKGKNEVMAIGGPWSPSLDGDDPSQNPQVLINTAIRTCRAQTGIDLSQCTRWHKFLELHYFRPAERLHPANKSDAQVGDSEVAAAVPEISPEPKVETVVIFFPDIHNCMPSDEEWAAQKTVYKELLDKKLASYLPETSATEETAAPAEGEAATDGQTGDNDVATTEKVEVAPTPIHYSKLDVSTMKVAELREQLEARQLDSKGLKTQLVHRLETALKEEERKDKAEAATKPVETAAESGDVSKDLETKPEPVELTEKDRRRLERLYRLEDERPAIIVHPSRNARSGKFDCEKLSLSTLLDYRQDDQKEHTFEVSLFCEQFRDMILRDCSFNIYRALLNAVEPPAAAKDAEGEDTKKDPEEPDSKRRRGVSTERKVDENGVVIRTVKRTVDPFLLFAFTVYDSGHTGYLKEEDVEAIIFSLGLNLSRAQVRKLIQKVSNKKPVVHYRCLTDKDIPEGSEEDVVNIRGLPAECIPEVALGNRAFFEEPEEIRVHVSCDENDFQVVEKLKTTEQLRNMAEMCLGEITAEYERTKKLLKDTQDADERCRRDIVRLSDDLTEDKKSLEEVHASNAIYYTLLKDAYSNLMTTSESIDRQFAIEKAAREAEEEAKRLAEEELRKAMEPPKEVEMVEENGGEVDPMDTDSKEAIEKTEDFTVLDSA